tara:strand:- start:135 stop:1061 length:927 start_codon:yes stop_codon:yes gene_type:complete
VKEKVIAIAGVSTLLGQLFLRKITERPSISVASLHDCLAETGASDISQSKDLMINSEVLAQFRNVPLLRPSDRSLAPLLISFLPELGAERCESKHLSEGTKVITHCEYARLTARMVCPNVLPDPDPQERHLVTPNCTTAICASPLDSIHKVHGIESATITTLQAISGTDLPGLHAYQIHDQVISQIEREACALTEELGRIFNQAFPIDVFATRVPVWRGHTITVSLTLKQSTPIAAIEETLRLTPGVRFDFGGQGRHYRDESDTYADPIATVTELRQGQHSVLIGLKGDNLGSATVGIMERALNMLDA